MSITPDVRLGPYEVTALIGEGGMGKVWRARHLGLKRDDALKVLPDAFASDPDRLARFRREAQVLASLNHPNIAHVYGLEQSAGVQALVMELVEGPTLADRIAQGPIPVDEALVIAKQIAEALEAAHEQGIIHRDLKPANIKLRPDGTVKVLDFGLAKALEPASAQNVDATDSPTIVSPAMMTGVGMLLGTAAYMSPEPARGKAVDKRSDIWAFGCVLYEMLTGSRAFGGEDVSDTLANVLKSALNWGQLPRTTPAEIRTLLRRCLQKDPRRRWQSATDVRIEIEEAVTALTDLAETPDQRPTVNWRWLLVSALMVILAAAAGGITGWNIRPGEQAPTLARVLLGVAPADQLAPALAVARPLFLATPFVEQWPEFSPDGRWLAYGSDQSGRAEVYVQAYPGPGRRVQVSNNGGTQPAWAQNGRELFYTEPGPNSTLRMMSVAVTLGDAFTADRPQTLFEGQYPSSVLVRGYEVTGDASHFLMRQQREESADPPITQIVLVQNWFEELKRLVPTN